MGIAAVCTELTGEGAIEIRDWPVAAPGPGEVRLAVRAASVNYPDVLMTRGLYQHRQEPPFVPGSECSGVVTDVGEGVTAVVVCNKGAGVDEASVLKALDGRLAKFKMPKRVFVVDELPRNAMGKVQKNILRDTYSDIYAKAK